MSTLHCRTGAAASRNVAPDAASSCCTYQIYDWLMRGTMSKRGNTSSYAAIYYSTTSASIGAKHHINEIIPHAEIPRFPHQLESRTIALSESCEFGLKPKNSAGATVRWPQQALEVSNPHIGLKIPESLSLVLLTSQCVPDTQAVVTQALYLQLPILVCLSFKEEG
ncbi:hypothetical protein BDR05DRAFT_952206 [Suillus weaverae]|nr:hypothetical protein BDR05DRAFT_952206 [Suillus weaverae]